MIDIGVNLTNPRFAKDCRDVLTRARDAGLSQCIITGTSLAESRSAIALVREYQRDFPGMLFCTAGIHPHEAATCTDEALAELAALIRDNPGVVVAVGETGLDFNRDFSPRDRQLCAFERQIELAIASGLPLFLHERDAQGQQLALLKEFGGDLPPAVLHCFTGDRRALDAYLDLGLWIGITGWVCDERRGTELQQLVAVIPEHKLLVETDAPYLLPRTLKPKPKSNRCEPAHLPAVVAMVAQCRGQSSEAVAAATAANAREMFRLPPSGGGSH